MIQHIYLTAFYFQLTWNHPRIALLFLFQPVEDGTACNKTKDINERKGLYLMPRMRLIINDIIVLRAILSVAVKSISVCKIFKFFQKYHWSWWSQATTLPISFWAHHCQYWDNPWNHNIYQNEVRKSVLWQHFACTMQSKLHYQEIYNHHHNHHWQKRNMKLVEQA